MTLSATISVMVESVAQAKKAIIRDYGEISKLQVSKKGTGDFVTATDLKVQKILVEKLDKARYGCGFLLEESEEIMAKPGKTGESYRWIIDPIDGTNNFMHGHPYFCISVALERTVTTEAGKKSEIIAGVILSPIYEELFWAELGKGAYLMSPDGNNTRLRVSARTVFEESMISIGSLSFGGELQQKIIKLLKEHHFTLRCSGSTALDMAYVAAGRSDGIIQNGIKPWDVAAGIVIIKEAGGYVTDIAASPDIMDNMNLLACNPKLHAKILDLLLEAQIIEQVRSNVLKLK